MRIKIWILASDTHDFGTDCDLFGSEAELNETLKVIMGDDADEHEELKALIESGDIDGAWDYWQENCRDCLDTYYVDSREIEVAIPQSVD